MNCTHSSSASDIAETVEPLDEVAERLRDEMVKELELRKK
jgi:hypothetical protein